MCLSEFWMKPCADLGLPRYIEFMWNKGPVYASHVVCTGGRASSPTCGWAWPHSMVRHSTPLSRAEWKTMFWKARKYCRRGFIVENWAWFDSNPSQVSTLSLVMTVPIWQTGRDVQSRIDGIGWCLASAKTCSRKLCWTIRTSSDEFTRHLLLLNLIRVSFVCPRDGSATW